MARRKERMIKVWEVSYTCGPNGEDTGPGPMGDGFQTARFLSEREAQAFAAGRSCWGGSSRPKLSEVPLRVAERWGLA